ncbi:hypothetical protein K450DRAFT_49878 [Umbelopsis ramanniana AG]|uniref:C2 domain-containing protein n=1 Tax=Umbelopsis ramanniana AG TaxID=1314678 RepID=A0AAD5EAQ3_UMBRA|nr:uncharacterized protein K450DRAFT_49878 [Umbelopsis ramanniana AG]KAI8580238.1 hypothetical protein K450DRAFT_49878 [Umbelopsis ramanniana AG]
MDAKPPLTPEPPQIALHFSCANLATRRTARRFARTPNQIIIQLHFYDPLTGKWRVRAQTDVGTGDNPVFSKAITMDYFFKYNSLMRADVYDTDNGAGDLSNQRLIGCVIFSSHALVTSPGGTLSAPLTKDPDGVVCNECNSTWLHVLHHLSTHSLTIQNMSRLKLCPICKGKMQPSRGMVNIACEKIQDVECTVTLQLSGVQLESMDVFGKSDPFYVISRRTTEGGGYVRVYTSEYHKNVAHVKFMKHRINMKELCNGNMDLPLTIEVYDWNSDNEPSLIGTLETSLRKLLSTKRSQLNALGRRSTDSLRPTTTPPRGPTKSLRMESNRRHRTPGYIKVLTCELHREPTFLDYIQSGSTDIELSLAIDFSASNDLVEKASLHYVDERDQHHLNAYEDAIRSVGDILLHYNSNREIPVYGFGAKLGSNKMEEDDFSRIEVSHCFPLNSDWANPHYSSIDEVIKAYRNLVHPLPEQFTLPESEIQDILGGDGKKDYVKRFAIPVREQIQFSYPTMFTPLLEEIEARVRASMTWVDRQNDQLQSAEWGGGDLNDVYDATTRRPSTTTIPRRPSLLASTDPSTGKRHIYHILVILTDGQAADFESATQKVKEMSKELPLCVVIIGVGAANFQLMKTIESASDTVKFVEFRKYAALNPDKSKQRGRSASTSAAFGHGELGDVISTGSAESGVLLARDVLADIPAQFLRYVRQQGTSRRGSQGTFSWTGDPTADEGFERIWATDPRLDERLPTYAEAIEQ